MERGRAYGIDGRFAPAIPARFYRYRREAGAVQESVPDEAGGRDEIFLDCTHTVKCRGLVISEISPAFEMPCIEEAIKGTFFCSGHARVSVKWRWLVMEGEAEMPDHACGPDCLCFQQKEKL